MMMNIMTEAIVPASRTVLIMRFLKPNRIRILEMMLIAAKISCRYSRIGLSATYSLLTAL